MKGITFYQNQLLVLIGTKVSQFSTASLYLDFHLQLKAVTHDMFAKKKEEERKEEPVSEPSSTDLQSVVQAIASLKIHLDNRLDDILSHLKNQEKRIENLENSLSKR